MKAYMFPGQGAQARGMGEELFNTFPELTARADEILGYSIKELCLQDPHQQLGQTRFTQPALYVVNALAFLKKCETEAPPAFLAGHSLGEYNALFAAGAYPFEIGLQLVKKRGELMDQARGGGMAAVIGLDAERVRVLLAENGATAVDIANLNSPFQVVISGAKDEIVRLQAPFQQAGATRYTVLRVSAAFHSRFMKPVMAEFGRFLESYDFAPPAIPVITNLTARPLRADRIRATLCEQIGNPVRWCESICYLMGKGVQEFVECGYGLMLTGMYFHIRRDAQPLIVDDDEPQPQPQGPSGSRSSEIRRISDEPAPLVIAAANRATPPQPAPPAVAVANGKISPKSLGSAVFQEDYRLRYAYVAGSMFEGIASRELVVRMGKAGLIGYLGTEGSTLDSIEESIRYIQRELCNGESYGMSLWCDSEAPRVEWDAVDLYHRYDIRNIEATGYLQMTPALVCFRLKGAYHDHTGRAATPRRVLARVSHPEVARAFMSPASEQILKQLLEEGRLTREEVALGRELPISEDICVHADSGGHTNLGVGAVLMPTMLRLRDEIMRQRGYGKPIRVGLSGGIGTPEAAASAFVLGADFVVTNSINQCSPEAGTSDRVKDMLQAMNVQDTAYAPAGDMFEMGARIQVLKRGVLFPVRANRLYDIYRHHQSLDELDKKTRDQLQTRYFKRDFGEIWREVQTRWRRTSPEDLAKAERDPKHKMALVFRWYFLYSSELARKGDEANQVDYQIHCGPAMGAFNQWVKGTDLEDWRNRHVEVIADRLMRASADLLNHRLRALAQ
jgi:trans-AT polyketide synthase, acyltransferase and oxidoreductase domains